MAARYNTIGDYTSMHHTAMVVSDQKFTFPTEVYLPSVKNYVMAKTDEAYNYLLYTTGNAKYDPAQYRFDKYEVIKPEEIPLTQRGKPIDDVALALNGPAVKGEKAPSALQVGIENYEADPRPPGCGCTNATKGMQLDKVFNPEFNLREIGKQMILLEDHLFNPYRRCTDCITKHTLMIEALIEEAITLDDSGKHTEQLQELLTSFRGISRQLLKEVKTKSLQSSNSAGYAQTIRKLRKPICIQYCDFY